MLDFLSISMPPLISALKSDFFLYYNINHLLKNQVFYLRIVIDNPIINVIPPNKATAIPVCNNVLIA